MFNNNEPEYNDLPINDRIYCIWDECNKNPNLSITDMNKDYQKTLYELDKEFPSSNMDHIIYTIHTEPDFNSNDFLIFNKKDNRLYITDGEYLKGYGNNGFWDDYYYKINDDKLYKVILYMMERTYIEIGDYQIWKLDDERKTYDLYFIKKTPNTLSLTDSLNKVKERSEIYNRKYNK